MATMTAAAPTAVAAPDAPLSEQRFLVLDGIRGLAILLVMQFHFWDLMFGILGRQPTERIDIELKKAIGVGWSGVDLFFVLSGFLITGILYDARHSNRYFSSFYARRFLRIFPLYYAYLIIVILILPHFPEYTRGLQINELKDVQWSYWTYFVNVAGSVKQFDTQVPIAHSQFWSLAVEEQFYLVWPAVVLLVPRRVPLMWLCAAIVVGALGFRWWLTTAPASHWFNLAGGHVLMPARMDTLAIGAFLALALRGDASEMRRLARFAPWVGAGALLVLLVLYKQQNGLIVWDHRVNTIGFSAFAVLFGALMVMALTARPGGPLYFALTNPVIRMFGRYAYGLYVIHLAVALQVIAHFGSQTSWVRTVHGSHIPTNILFNLLATAITLAIAVVSWHLFEKQVLKLKRFFPYRDGARRPREAATPVSAPEGAPALEPVQAEATRAM
jgi:peptidoglycan/LPS O-acetylase OafA/YrhL